MRGRQLPDRQNRSIFAGPVSYAALGDESVAAHFVRPFTTTETPPSGLGYTAAEDRQFATTVGDYGPAIGWRRTGWKPLWNEAHIVLANKKLEHELQILTPHSHLEEIQLFSPAYTRAPAASSWSLPTEQPYFK